MGNSPSRDQVYSDEEEEESEYNPVEEEKVRGSEQDPTPVLRTPQLYLSASDEECFEAYEEEEDDDDDEDQQVSSPKNHRIQRYSMPRPRKTDRHKRGVFDSSSSEEEEDEKISHRVTRGSKKRPRMQRRAPSPSPPPPLLERREVLRSRTECEDLILDLRFDEANRILEVMEYPNEEYDLVDHMNNRVGVFACSTAEIPGTRRMLEVITKCEKEISQLSTKLEKMRLSTRQIIAHETRRQNGDMVKATQIVRKSTHVKKLQTTCLNTQKHLAECENKLLLVTNQYDQLKFTHSNMAMLEEEKEIVDEINASLPTTEQINAVTGDLEEAQRDFDDTVNAANEAMESQATSNPTMDDFDERDLEDASYFLIGMEPRPRNVAPVRIAPTTDGAGGGSGAGGNSGNGGQREAGAIMADAPSITSEMRVSIAPEVPTKEPTRTNGRKEKKKRGLTPALQAD